MRIHLLAVTAMACCALASCSSDPLSTTCGQYLAKGEAEQLDLAALWGEPNRSTLTKMGQIVAPSYRKDLLAYCPSHTEERLRDLHLTFR